MHLPQESVAPALGALRHGFDSQVGIYTANRILSDVLNPLSSRSLLSDSGVRYRMSRKRPLISDGRIVNRTIEKMIQQLHYFKLTQDFGPALQDVFLLQVLPQIFLGENDGPDEFADRHPLVDAAGADFFIALLDVEFALTEKPVPEMAINSYTRC